MRTAPVVWLVAMTAWLVAANTGIAAPCAPKLAAGGWHSIAVRDDGTVASWGGGELGQLGHGGQDDVLAPTAVATFGRGTFVASGHGHTLAVLGDGTMRAWGGNGDGQLGDGSRTASRVPVAVTGITDATAAAAGAFHSLALTASETVLAWGRNSVGQLGDTRALRSTIPVAVIDGLDFMPVREVIAIAAGLSHSLALRRDGRVYTWGNNVHGELGDGNLGGPYATVATTVAGLDQVTAVTAGVSHSLVSRSDGTVWAWGMNAFGAVGDGSTTDRPRPLPVSGLTGATAVAAGGYHSLALLDDGRVWAWGLNRYGQLGDATTTDRLQPVLVSGLSGIVAIAAGRFHSLALTSDGRVLAWGFNEHGELGNGTRAGANVPVESVLLCASCGIAADVAAVAPVPPGSMITLDASATTGTACTGSLLYQWEDGATVLRPFDPSPRLDLIVNRRITIRLRVRCDTDPSCEGSVDETVTVVPAPSCELTAIAAGTSISMALERNGLVWTWGDNRYGQLGNGSFTPGLPLGVAVAAPVIDLADVTAIATGEHHMLAVDVDGRVWAWGRNDSGSLGDGGSEHSPRPILVPEVREVVAVTASGSHCFAVKRDGTVWAWGRNDRGQVGDGTFQERLDIVLPVPVVGLARALAVAAGGDRSNTAGHSLAVLPTRALAAWGENLNGQLGNGLLEGWPWRTLPLTPVTPFRMIAVAAGTAHSMALADDGGVWTWGSNLFGQLGDGTTNRNPTPRALSSLAGTREIDAQWFNSMALRQDNTLWMWGGNAYGMLGNGTTVDSMVPSQVVGLAGVTEIALGQHSAMALLGDGSLWAWGSNFAGELGIGSFGPASAPGSTIPVRVISSWDLPAADVTGNSLRAVRVGANAALSWSSSSGAGSWNLHRTAIAPDLPSIWTQPAIATSVSTNLADPAPPPGSAAPWFYQVFGADCRGVSQP